MGVAEVWRMDGPCLPPGISPLQRSRGGLEPPYLSGIPRCSCGWRRLLRPGLPRAFPPPLRRSVLLREHRRRPKAGSPRRVPGGEPSPLARMMMRSSAGKTAIWAPRVLASVAATELHPRNPPGPDHGRKAWRSLGGSRRRPESAGGARTRWAGQLMRADSSEATSVCDDGRRAMPLRDRAFLA